ncbi:hypothetical protein E3AUHO_50940 [Klebsiella pneumoniae subsp. pneumoniae]|nr:hypothetical protein E3AUHO_50940 [Klebsiella pneumoniae subsp. pneumoniae]
MSQQHLLHEEDLSAILTGNLVGPRKRQRRRAMATSREPFLCRVAAAPDPAYMRDGTAGPAIS